VVLSKKYITKSNSNLGQSIQFSIITDLHISLVWVSVMKLFIKISNPCGIRRKLGLVQRDFWSRVGVSQSVGSRYESGRNMPPVFRKLVRLVYIERGDLTKIRKDDLIVANLLKVA